MNIFRGYYPFQDTKFFLKWSSRKSVGFGEQISSEEKYRGYCICKKNETNYQIENSCPYAHTTEPPLSDSASIKRNQKKKNSRKNLPRKTCATRIKYPNKVNIWHGKIFKRLGFFFYLNCCLRRREETKASDWDWEFSKLPDLSLCCIFSFLFLFL